MSQSSVDTVTITENITGVKEPERYRVVILNDNSTPMEFVIELLKVKVTLSSKKLDMSLISFMKELEKHIDKTRFNEVMNLLDNTKALEVVKL